MNDSVSGCIITIIISTLRNKQEGFKSTYVGEGGVDQGLPEVGFLGQSEQESASWLKVRVAGVCSKHWEQHVCQL